MTENHLITPPPELVQHWLYAASSVPAFLTTGLGGRRDHIDYIATEAARWGADQELEACCEWLADCSGIEHPELVARSLRAARRPHPPSLKDQALEALDRMDQLPTAKDQFIIRCALEQLDD